MSTLRELWQAVFPTARVLARPPEREVGWVRVLKSRVPAFDALEAADLAIDVYGEHSMALPSREELVFEAESILAQTKASKDPQRSRKR